jgi:hypothetical protein
MQNLMTIVITILPIHQYQYSSRDYAQYSDVLNQLINQGYVAHRIKSLLQTFYSRHHELVDGYEISTISNGSGV